MFVWAGVSPLTCGPPTAPRLGLVLFMGLGRPLVRCSRVVSSMGGSSPTHAA